MIIETDDQAFLDFEHIGMLAINLLKNPLTLGESMTFASQKVLSNVDDEDMIEVFV